MTAISKYVCINKFIKIVKEYNYTPQNQMKMKACNVKPHGYIYLDHGKDTKNEFNVGDHIRVSEYIFLVKSYQHNCAKEVFVITNVDDSIP